MCGQLPPYAPCAIIYVRPSAELMAPGLVCVFLGLYNYSRIFSRLFSSEGFGDTTQSLDIYLPFPICCLSSSHSNLNTNTNANSKHSFKLHLPSIYPSTFSTSPQRFNHQHDSGKVFPIGCCKGLGIRETHQRIPFSTAVRAVRPLRSYHHPHLKFFTNTD